MPWPEIAYMTNAITASCQPRPQPQATGTAAATASSGTTMKAARIHCSMRARRIVPGTAARGCGSALWVRGAVRTGGRGWTVVGAVMHLSLADGGPLVNPYATVTYAAVTSRVGNVT